MRDIWDWDTGVYLGQIEEASHTYNVVGNINEWGLAIGETTYGGLEVLQTQSGAKIDYGSLIWVTLMRARTAREAISVMADLVATYGYYSEGESFSISDSKEAWIMELIGKGEYELGAVWVARRIPAGYFTAHANQARITTFPLDDPENCLYSEDVISFARKIGVYSGSDADFSFSDVYDEVTFSGARFCEARVWSIFGAVLGSEWADNYLDYAQGYNLTNRMPLWVAPPEGVKIDIELAMDLMRSHYDNTWFDMSGEQRQDVSASYGSDRTRYHPLTWTATSGQEYLNERPIATQQTGWNFISQSRPNMPAELSGLLWFGIDDSSTTVRFPIYGSATRVPQSFAGKGMQDGVTPPLTQFNMDSAFTVFNLVANWVYSRWNAIYPEVFTRIQAREAQYVAEIRTLDTEAQEAFASQGAAAAVELVTAYSERTGDALVKEWGQFFGDLFMKYRDGYIVTSDTTVGSDPYPTQWYDRIASTTGDHYKVVSDDEGGKLQDKLFRTKAKTDLRALR